MSYQQQIVVVGDTFYWHALYIYHGMAGMAA